MALTFCYLSELREHLQSLDYGQVAPPSLLGYNLRGFLENPPSRVFSTFFCTGDIGPYAVIIRISGN